MSILKPHSSIVAETQSWGLIFASAMAKFWGFLSSKTWYGRGWQGLTPGVYAGSLLYVTQSPYLILTQLWPKPPWTPLGSTLPAPFRCQETKDRFPSPGPFPHHHEYEMSPQTCSLHALAGP